MFSFVHTHLKTNAIAENPSQACCCKHKKHNINIKSSRMIGDKEADIQAANATGIHNTILARSGHTIDEKTSNASWIVDSIQQSINLIQ